MHSVLQKKPQPNKNPSKTNYSDCPEISAFTS